MNENLPIWVQNFLWVALVIGITIFLCFVLLALIAVIKLLIEEGKADE